MACAGFFRIGLLRVLSATEAIANTRSSRSSLAPQPLSLSSHPETFSKHYFSCSNFLHSKQHCSEALEDTMRCNAEKLAQSENLSTSPAIKPLNALHPQSPFILSHQLSTFASTPHHPCLRFSPHITSDLPSSSDASLLNHSCGAGAWEQAQQQQQQKQEQARLLSELERKQRECQHAMPRRGRKHRTRLEGEKAQDEARGEREDEA